MRDWAAFNAKVIEEFRANDGVVAQLGGNLAVVLHTIGARSGEVRLVPLIPVSEGDATLLFATAAGAPKHPDWYFNLKANPRIVVEDGTGTYTADVFELPEDEAIRIVLARAALVPQLADYVEAASPRVIPVFSVERL